MFKGTEHFLNTNKTENMTITDFWSWAYSDLSNNINRSVLAEYIVATAICATDVCRLMWRPFDLLSPSGYKIEVKSAAYVQSWQKKHPDHVSYRIAPARLPDSTGDYKDDAPVQRNSDAYVFCLYKALTPDQNPLDLDLWEFYVISTKVLNKYKPNQKSITLPSLVQLNPVKCDYNSLSDAINTVMNS